MPTKNAIPNRTPTTIPATFVLDPDPDPAEYGVGAGVGYGVGAGVGACVIKA